MVIMARSIWQQGLRSSYRKAYWKFLLRTLGRYGMNRSKLWLGATILISGNHFIPYAGDVVRKIEGEVLRAAPRPELVPILAGD
jgi:hypothetical protein